MAHQPGSSFRGHRCGGGMVVPVGMAGDSLTTSWFERRHRVMPPPYLSHEGTKSTRKIGENTQILPSVENS